MDKVESIKVNSLTDLNRVIKELLPVAIENKTRMVNMENIEDPQGNLYKNFPVKFADDGQPMVRKLLVDGFELLKRQQEFSSASGIFAGDDIDGFGGFYPAVKPVDDIGTGWVTSFVSKHLDGKIEDLSVVWNIPEGKYKLNPWTGDLVKVTKDVADTA